MSQEEEVDGGAGGLLFRGRTPETVDAYGTKEKWFISINLTINLLLRCTIYVYIFIYIIFISKYTTNE